MGKEFDITIKGSGGSQAAGEFDKTTKAIDGTTEATRAYNDALAKSAQAAMTGGGAADVDSITQQKQAIASTLAEAAAEEAAGHTASATALRAEAAEMELALKFQQQLKLSEAESLALARARLTAERQVEAAKAATLAAAKAAALAEKEEAAAALAAQQAADGRSGKLARAAQTFQGVAASHAGLGRAGGVEFRGLENMLGMSNALIGVTAAAAVAVTGVGGIMRAQDAAADSARKLDMQWTQTRNDFAMELHFASLEELPGLVQNVSSHIKNLQTQIAEIPRTGQTGWEVFKEWASGAETAEQKMDRLSEMIAQHERDAAAALAKQAELGAEVVRIAQLRANGQAREADEAERALKLNTEIEKIKKEALAAPGTADTRDKLIEQAQQKAEAEKQKREEERQRRVSKEISDADDLLKIAQAEAAGDGPAAKLLQIKKEHADTIAKIKQQEAKGELTPGEAAHRRQQTDDIAAAKNLAVGQERFRKDFDADKQRHHETLKQRDERRAREKKDRAEDRAQIDRNIAHQEAEMANGRWEKQGKGYPDKFIPGRRMTEAEKTASRKAQEEALKRDREPKKERHSDQDLDDIKKPAAPQKPPAQPAAPAEGGANLQPVNEAAKQSAQDVQKAAEAVQKAGGQMVVGIVKIGAIVERVGSTLENVCARLSSLENLSQ